MKKIFKVSIGVLILLIGFTSFCEAQIKVACVGNSITENSALEQNQKYPSILQTLLGTDYQVRNYGIGGRTLLRKGNYPYWNEAKYTEVLNWKPDIVIIKLGTNDAKPQNWQYGDEFETDYRDFVASFEALSSAPKIFVCYPLPAFAGNWIQASDEVIVNEMIPIITKIANEKSLSGIIDLHTPFIGKEDLTYDKIHPNFRGTTYMAHIIAKEVCSTCSIPDVPEDFFMRKSSSDYTDKCTSFTSSLTDVNALNNLIDNDLLTEFSVPFVANTWFRFDFEKPIKLTGYAFSSTKDNAQSPKSWKIEGSNDGSSWVEIDAQNNAALAVLETKVVQTPYTALDNLKAYKHFRITITENNGDSHLALKELQMFGFPETLAADLTKNGGTITGEHVGYTGETVENLIDGKLGKKYCVTGKNKGWIQYKSPTPLIVNGYSITSCYNLFERNLKKWQIQGSNDGSIWVVLDERSDEDFMSRFHLMEYSFPNTTAYTYYRLNILENNGGGDFQFAEWQLFGGENSSISSVSVDNRVLVENGKIKINSNGEFLTYNILNLSGQSLEKGSVSTGTKLIENYGSGLYIVEIRDCKGSLVKKISL